MNENESFEKQEVISVKELASDLRVSDQTIRNTVKELFPDPTKLLWRVINGGNCLFLNKAQATAVKLKLRTRNNLKDNSAVTQIGNDLEFFALLKQREQEQRLLDEYRDRRIAELKAENEAMKPKALAYDEFVSREKFCNFTDAANYLNIKRHELIKLLNTKYIYKNSVGEYRAYSNYSRYFALRPFEKGSVVGQQLMFTIEGLDYFKEKFHKIEGR